MEAVAIVPDLDIFEEGPACLSTVDELAGGTFGLEGAKEAFHDGVIIAVAHPAHADQAMMGLQLQLISQAGVLAALVGVVQETIRWMTSGQGHL